jgi:hypothetical protein
LVPVPASNTGSCADDESLRQATCRAVAVALVAVRNAAIDVRAAASDTLQSLRQSAAVGAAIATTARNCPAAAELPAKLLRLDEQSRLRPGCTSARRRNRCVSISDVAPTTLLPLALGPPDIRRVRPGRPHLPLDAVWRRYGTFRCSFAVAVRRFTPEARSEKFGPPAFSRAVGLKPKARSECETGPTLTIWLQSGPVNYLSAYSYSNANTTYCPHAPPGGR